MRNHMEGVVVGEADDSVDGMMRVDGKLRVPA
jgi:hypothetical protein